MHLEKVLRQVDPNPDKAFHGRLPYPRPATGHALALDAVRARPSTSSLRGAEQRSNPRVVGRSTFPGLLRFARNDGALASICSEIAPENSVGPDALGVAGPCFAARETSGMLQMISRRRNAWPSRPPPSMFGQRFYRAPFRSGMSSGDSALTLVTPGSFLLVRRSHGYPVFLPRLQIGRRLRRLRIACS